MKKCSGTTGGASALAVSAVILAFMAFPASDCLCRTAVFAEVSDVCDGGDGNTDAIMRLLGTDSPELLDEYEVERLSAFIENPIDINLAAGSRLVSSGLFTQYQVASLLDYRKRNGDILSMKELAAVDGFSQERAEALAPFVSLYSEAAPGAATERGRRIRNSLSVRSNVRDVAGEPGYAYGLKYRFSMNDCLEIGVTANRTYGSRTDYPDGGSFHLVYYGRRRLGKIVIGDYNLRYGQGLALWNGFRMTSLDSPESFYLRPSGISPYWSYSGTGSWRGVAADFNIGRFAVSSSVALNGLREMMRGEKSRGLSLLPAVNVMWYGSDAQVSVTGYAETAGFGVMEEARAGSIGSGGMPRGLSAAGCSADFRWCVKGVDLFGEAALDAIGMKVSAVAGAVFNAGECLTLACRTGYSAGQYSVAAGGRFRAGDDIRLKGRSGFGSTVKRHSGTFSADAAYFPEPKYGSVGPGTQLRLKVNYTLQVSPSVALSARLSERLRNGTEKSRLDVRVDLKYSSGDWACNMRINGLHNRSLGILGYAEGGWKPDWMSVYLRAGLFRIDNWQDRIYVYERDAPGNFNVPAYYGRGCWGAMTVGFKLLRWFRIYLRVAALQYPWVSPMASERLPKNECRVLLSFSL